VSNANRPIDPNDGIAWRDAVFRCAYAMRRGDHDAADTLENLKSQVSGRQKHDSEFLSLLIDGELLPEIKKGRPTGARTKAVEILSASQDYFDLTETNPSGPLRQKPKGKKGCSTRGPELAEPIDGVAAYVGKPLNVSERTVQDWLSNYRDAIKVLGGQGYDGKSIMRELIDMNRVR
jgi:hypothetical protein